ncbi:MAG: nucleotidyltransferase [Planctomycetota bacterium]|nr:nucleotidyltransferase [Planctomycetota bacterium]
MAMIRLPIDFKEFFELLNSEKVDYLLVGGYAVIHYGYSRATGDIDIWVRPTLANGEALVRCLEQFGFSVGAVDATKFVEPRKVFQIGIPPLRIDLLTGIEGVEFDNCFEQGSIIDCEGTSIRIISLADLRINKQATGRAKDQADLDYLP